MFIVRANIDDPINHTRRGQDWPSALESPQQIAGFCMQSIQGAVNTPYIERLSVDGWRRCPGLLGIKSPQFFSTERIQCIYICIRRAKKDLAIPAHGG